jgi:hypothetical protein
MSISVIKGDKVCNYPRYVYICFKVAAGFLGMQLVVNGGVSSWIEGRLAM